MLILSLLLQVADAPAGWGALGVGGALAGVMFYFYRQDRQVSETRMATILADFRSIIEANTKAMTSLERAIEDRESH
jgi:hypothetical protein